MYLGRNTKLLNTMQSNILGIPINILLDTGACNVLHKKVYDKLKLQYPGIKLDVCGVEHTRLRSFCGSDTKINAKLTLQLPIEGKLSEIETLLVKELQLDLILGQFKKKLLKKLILTFQIIVYD